MRYRLNDIRIQIMADIEHYNLSINGYLLVNKAVMEKMLNHFGNRQLKMDYDDSPYAAFKEQWDLFINTNRPNYEKIIDAYSAEYNPINNYDMTEEKTTHHDGNNTYTTEGGSQSSNDFPSKMEQYVTSDENPNGRLSAYTTSNSAVTSSSNNTRTDSIADINETLSRKGNIGVTTSQQMIESEIKLRILNLSNKIIRDFCMENTMYANEVNIYDDNYIFLYW